MKKAFISGLACILLMLCLGTQGLTADTISGMDQEKVDLYAGKLMKALTKDKVKLLMAMPVKFYFAGASFQKSTLAPTDRVGHYESYESKRLMSSLYYTDGAYSQLCRKKKLALKFFEAWNELTEEFVTLFTPELKADLFDTTKKILAKYRSDSPEEISGMMADLMMQGNEQLVNSSLGIEVVVDGFYASLIEVMYLSTSMIIPLSPKSKLIPRFQKAAREQMTVADDVITAMESDPEFAKICNTPERRRVIQSLTDILDKGTFKMDDLKEIHAIVHPIREAIIDMK